MSKKNINTKYKNLVRHDYNKTNVIAIDILSIPIKSNHTNHAYLSIAINHKTKFIESWNISLRNNSDLIIKAFQKYEFKNRIVHSNYGTQYSSKEFSLLIKGLGQRFLCPLLTML